MDTSKELIVLYEAAKKLEQIASKMTYGKQAKIVKSFYDEFSESKLDLCGDTFKVTGVFFGWTQPYVWLEGIQCSVPISVLKFKDKSQS